VTLWPRKARKDHETAETGFIDDGKFQRAFANGEGHRRSPGD
jgi:hypothetical protein